ncbi:DUF3556 domain-containing protein [Rhodococcus opacus]|uniref:DUF3556 domain-containing protein n=1 Tax=Rhodococcus opacus TaxID=37919 RepID=A0A2S8J4F7_RHOOP|nr:DUF3556 domain-containing protein [Rhodococcus opacus]PQP21941.1 hypothetical protein C5613_24695 [Rhodococcus opacus]
MGFTTPDLPDIEYAEWKTRPRSKRLETVSRHWVEHGFGTPYAVYLLYAVKCAFYIIGAATVISLTPGLGSLGDVGSWWTEPIVYQKLVIWTLLYEVIGLGCGSGPLTSRFVPPIGGILYFLRVGTLRLPPWPGKVPFTRGDERTIVDVGLYALVLASGVWALLQTGQGGPVTDSGDVGLIDPLTVIPLIASLVLLGLRDKTVFLAARAEQFGLTLLVFFFPFVDMMVGFKLIMLALWWGAATSKLNHHFPYVVAVMMSNSPLLRSTWLKRKMYRDPHNDLRPSWVPSVLAHGGTAIEYLVPGYLVFLGDGGPLTWAAIIFMALFHLHIISTIPMGVPLEWNIFFIFSLFYLFGHYGSISVFDLGSPLLLAILLVALLAIPILGHVRPDLISFLPAMRYYAGNWATSAWCFRPGAEGKLEQQVKKVAALPINQLTKLYGAATAETMLAMALGWRSIHTHGRALNGLISRAVDDEDAYTVRDGEVVAGPMLGWNFGEGHLHNENLLAAVQRRCQFEEGELRVVVLESQPMHRQRQAYRIFDAQTGLIEEGYVLVKDMLTRQPWPDPADSFPVHLTGANGGEARHAAGLR